MLAALIAVIIVGISLLVGYSRSQKAKTARTTFTGTDLAPDIETRGSGKSKLHQKLKSAAGSWTSKLWEQVKKTLSGSAIPYLIAFGGTHYLAWYYFPVQYRFVFSNPAIWCLQGLLILWALVKNEVGKHKGVSFLVKTSIAIVAFATALVIYNKWDRRNCEVKGPDCSTKEVTEKARVAADEYHAKLVDDLQHHSLILMPKEQVDTIVLTDQFSLLIVPPSDKSGYRMCWDPEIPTTWWSVRINETYDLHVNPGDPDLRFPILPQALRFKQDVGTGTKMIIRVYNYAKGHSCPSLLPSSQS